jgi:Na+-transporting methylmalonyl-CoA/oxaloacetate decarboxylase gamma subunit
VTELSQGLQIVAVGIGGVFVNLFVLMLVLMGIGRIFGKKKVQK